jgi:hypothetical protein
MINPLIAYELAKEHQRVPADEARHRVLAHQSNAADGGRQAARVLRAVAKGPAALRRSSCATSPAQTMQRAHDRTHRAMNSKEGERNVSRATSGASAQQCSAGIIARSTGG